MNLKLKHEIIGFIYKRRVSNLREGIWTTSSDILLEFGLTHAEVNDLWISLGHEGLIETNVNNDLFFLTHSGKAAYIDELFLKRRYEPLLKWIPIVTTIIGVILTMTSLSSYP